MPRGPAWCAASRPVRSLPVLQSAFPTPWCLSPSQGLSPPDLLGGCAGHQRPAENRAHCACRWPPPRQGRWARSASYPLGAPRWGCPWRGSPASVLGCVRCGGWRVWIQSLTRPVSRTVRLSTGDSAGAPGLFRVDAGSSPCRSVDATGVRVLVPPGRVGRAGLPGAFWCASLFPLAALSFCFARPPPGWCCPFLGPLLALPLFLLPSPPPPPPFFFPPRAHLCLLLSLVPGPGCLGPWRFVFLPPPGLWFFFCAPLISGFLSFPVPGALGLGAVCCLFCWPPACRLSVLSRLVCVSRPAVGCSLVVAASHPAPPYVSRGFRRCLSPFVFFLVVRPRCLWLSLVPGLGWRGPWCCGFFLWRPSASLLSLRSRLLCVSRLAVGCSPVVAAPPPVPFLARCFRRSVLLFFFFALSFLRCLCPRCLWPSLVSGPGCPWPWRWVLFVLVASHFSACCALSPLLCFPPGPWLLPRGSCTPPPLCLVVFVASSRSRGFFLFSFFFRAPPCL